MIVEIFIILKFFEKLYMYLIMGGGVYESIMKKKNIIYWIWRVVFGFFLYILRIKRLIICIYNDKLCNKVS